MRLTRRSFILASGASLVLPAAPPLISPHQLPPGSRPSASAQAATLQQMLDAAGESAVITGEWVLDETVVLPHSLLELEIASGARLIATGDFPALARRGEIESPRSVPSLAAGATGFDDAGGPWAVGDRVLLVGNDTISGSNDKYGYLRRIVSVAGGRVELDRPLPRQLVMNPRCGRVSFAPTIRVSGSGSLVNATPSASARPLFELFAVDGPVITDIDLSENGGPGITLSHCWGGEVAAVIHDLLDDGVTHFGYGVNVAGATRDARIAGTIARVRHAVTTSPGPSITGYGNAGEPEECTFEPFARDCTDKAIDTHRAGWGITIIPRVEGGRGGVQVRADNTRVMGGSVTGTVGPGVAVAAVVAVPPTIEGVVISDLWPSGNGVLALSPIVMRDVHIRDCAWTNIILASNSIVSGGSINAGHPTGVEFRGSGNTVTGISLGQSVTTPYVELEGATNNTFEASGTEPDALPAAVATSLPTISGALTVGTELTASTGAWSRPRLSYRWTWFRDGEPIPNAVLRTYPRYAISSADRGCRLTVEVTAQRVGYADGRATSLATEIIGAAGQVQMTTAPVLSGTGATGRFLYISKGQWEPYPSTITFQWLSDGAVIAGATAMSYQVRAADAGRVVTARATATKSGYVDGVHAPVGIAIGGLPINPTTPPTLSGTPRVGKFLYVSRGAWTPYPSTVSMQWLVGNVAVAGATSGSYQVRPSDAGKAITAVVTAKRSGYTDGVFRPDPIMVDPTALVATVAPVVSGTPTVGRFLYVSRGEWSPYATSVRFQWRVDGVAIAGATSGSYQVRAADSGKTISVLVTASRTGNLDGVVQTNGVLV